MQGHGSPTGKRVEARRSFRERQIQARLFLAVGIAVGVVALFVDWKAAILPPLIGVALYWAMLAGAPRLGAIEPPVFVVEERGIQVGNMPLVPWNLMSAVKIQSQMFGARGANLVIEYTDAHAPTSVALSELDVAPEDIRAVVREYAPGLLGHENPVFRA